nr:hypothetical protein [Tanacetum cinerariifolium]
GRIEAVDSDGHLRSCPSDLGGIVGSRGNRSFGRLAGSRRIRVGSWNVGSLTPYFQETKWKGSRAREGNGYKLWYSGSSIARNRVGIILAGRLKDNVVRVTRRSDRYMAIYVVIKGETVNVISAYAPQVGLSDADKKRFWDALDEMVRECPTNQRLIIGGDLNGHIGAAANGYAEVHGGFGFGDRNEEGGHNTQIDYLLVRRGDLKPCKDCRAFPVEACSSQHRLIIVDVLLERLRHRREATRRPRILWKNLNGEWPRRKTKHTKDLYKKLDSKKGVNDIYKIAKARERRRRDIGNVKYIKDEGGRTIVREEDIRTRRGEYFSSLFNETPSEESRPEGSGEVGRSSPPTHAVGPDQIPIEAWRCLGDEGVKWLTCLFNKIFSSAKMPDEWRLSEVIPVYKNKGDAQACSNYRGHVRGGEDPRTDHSGEHRVFPAKVGLHQGSAISPYLFTLILDELSRGIQENIPWCMIFGDDIVLIAVSAERLNNRFESWRKTLEDNGLRVSREKTEYLKCDFGRHDIKRSFQKALDVDSIIDKMGEGRLRWFGHVKRRPQSAPVRRVEAMVVEGSRRRGRPKLRLEDRLKMDLKELRLSEDMNSDRNAWRD